MIDKEAQATSLFTKEELSELWGRLDKFRTQFHARTTEHYILLGTVVHCHLVLEDYIVKEIKDLNPNIGDFEKVITNFSPKLALLEKSESPMKHSLPELRAINSVRNRLSHRLNYIEIPEEQVADLRKGTLSYFPDTKDLTALQLIVVYTSFFVLMVEVWQAARNKVKQLEVERNKFLEEHFQMIEALFSPVDEN